MLKISLALGGVFALRFTFMGGSLGYDGRTHLEVPRKSLKSQNRPIIGVDNGYWVSVFGVIRLVLG